MSSENQTIFQETISLLEQTFTVTDNTKRKEAENKLKLKEKETLSHIKIIFDGIFMNMIRESLRLSIFTYLHNLIQTYQKNKLIIPSDMIEILRLYMDFILKAGFLSNKCILKINQTIKSLFEYCLLLDKQNILSIEVVNLLISNVRTEEMNEYQSNTVESYKKLYIVFILFNTLFSSSLVNQKNSIEVYNLSKDWVYKIFTHLILSKFPSYINLANEDYNNCVVYKRVFSTSQVLCDFIDYLTFVESFFIFLKNLIIKFRSRLSQLNNILNSIIGYIPDILIFITSNPISNSNSPLSIFISFTNYSPLNRLLNSCKSNAFLFLNLIFMNLSKEYMRLILLNKQVILNTLSKITSDLKSTIQNNLFYINSMSSEGGISGNDPVDDCHSRLIYESIHYISKIIEIDEFIEVLYGDMKNLIFYIILPLLSSTKCDYELSVSNGEEYFNLITDVIDGHSIVNIKSVCGYILKKIIKIYDGILNYIIQVSMEMILISHYMQEGSHEVYKNTLNISNFNEFLLYIRYVTEKENVILNDTSSFIFKVLKPVNVQEVAILCICIIGNSVLNNKTQLLLIKNFLDRCLDVLLKSNNPILLDKICLLIRIYSENIYEFNSQSMKNIISILFLCIFSNSEGLIQSASYALLEILSRSSIESQSEVILKNMSELIERIKVTSSCLLIDCFYQIVLKLNVDTYNLKTLEVSIERVLKEVSILLKMRFVITKVKTSSIENDEYQVNDLYDKEENGKPKKNTFILNKLLNIVRLLLANEGFVTSQSTQIEIIVSSLLKYMSILHKSDMSFDEDLIDISYQILRHYRIYSDIHNLVYPYILNYILKNKGLTFDAFIYLNQCILYGEEKLFRTDEGRNYFIEIVKLSLSSESEIEMSDFLGGSLLTLLLMHTTCLSDYFLKQSINIIKYYLNEIISENEEGSITSKPFFYLSLTSSLVSVFNNYSNSMINIMSSDNDVLTFGYLMSILEKLLNSSEIYNNFLFKVIIIGLTKLLNTYLSLHDKNITNNHSLFSVNNSKNLNFPNKNSLFSSSNKEDQLFFNKFNFFIILKYIIVLLQKQKNHESHYIKSKLKKKVNLYHPKKDYDIDNEDDEKNQNHGRIEMNMKNSLRKEKQVDDMCLNSDNEENENEYSDEDSNEETEKNLYLFKFNVKSYQGTVKKEGNLYETNENDMINICKDMNLIEEVNSASDFISQIESKYKQFDEYSYFKLIINEINNKHNDVIEEFCSMISPTEKSIFNHLIKTKRVKLNSILDENVNFKVRFIEEDKEVDTIPRKCVKIKRNHI